MMSVTGGGGGGGTGGKRIAKRSIIGTGVCVQTITGFWKQATIVSVRSDEERLLPIEKKFEVEFDDGSEGYERFYSVSKICGPGFTSSVPRHVKLNKGQEVFLTHNGREIKSKVESHDTENDCVELFSEGVGRILSNLDDLRLLQSRKSARLVNTDTDFSRMADVNIAAQRRKIREAGGGHSRRRLHSMSCFPDKKPEVAAGSGGRVRPFSEKSAGRRTSIATASIDVPNSRKRRTSESRLELESGYSSSLCSSVGGYSNNGGSLSSSLSSSILNASLLRSREELAASLLKSKQEMDGVKLESTDDVRDCTAAMVLMNLSVSPSDRWRDLSSVIRPPLSSSPCTPQPSPASSSPPCSRIEEDEEPLRKHQRSSTVTYCCTWRGCTQQTADLAAIERHVRGHMGRPEPQEGEERDFEEEFYYTEVDSDLDPNASEELIDIMEADIVIENNLPGQALTNYTSNTIQQQHQQSQQQHLLQQQPQQLHHNYSFGDHTFAINPQQSKTVQTSSSGGSSSGVSSGSNSPPIQMATSAPSSISLVNYLRPPPSGISEHLDMVKSPKLLLFPEAAAFGSNARSSPSTLVQQGKKLVSIVPKPTATSMATESNWAHQKFMKPFIFSPSSSSSSAVSPQKAGKSDRKCRKVYGLEQRDLWCTQCRWKKACVRFN